MNTFSKIDTSIKKKVSEIAEVASGVYLQASPYGEVAYLQIKDLLSESPVKTASKVTLSPKNERYLLEKATCCLPGKGQPTFAKCSISTFQPSPPPPYI